MTQSERSALLHIGVHKTGTTAFQTWAGRNREELATVRGLTCFRGFIRTNNPFEFGLLAMRSNRMAPTKVKFPEWCLPEWQEEAREHIGEQVASDINQLLISAEIMSLLRYEDEVEALADLLAPRSIRVAVCLRRPTPFLRSFQNELVRQGMEGHSHYRSSIFYAEPDSWLVDWDELVGVWRRVLGRENVVSFSYEEALERYGSTIPGALEALGIELDGLPSWRDHWRNASRSPGSRSAVRGVAHRVRSGLHGFIDPPN